MRVVAAVVVLLVAMGVAVAGVFGARSSQLSRKELLVRDLVRNHPPPLELPDPIAPETAGMKEGVSAPFPASMFLISEGRAYELVEGADRTRVRMYFAVERSSDGTGAVIVMHRNNLGLGRWTASRPIRVEVFPSPEPAGGALHIRGFKEGLLHLMNDEGSRFAFNIRQERFE
jgi:hypothetical protein